MQDPAARTADIENTPGLSPEEASDPPAFRPTRLPLYYSQQFEPPHLSQEFRKDFKRTPGSRVTKGAEDRRKLKCPDDLTCNRSETMIRVAMSGSVPELPDDSPAPEQVSPFDGPLDEYLRIDFAPDDSSPPLDEARLKAFVARKLEKDDEDEIAHLVATFRPWYEAFVRILGAEPPPETAQ
jgi:hypothetical protein